MIVTNEEKIIKVLKFIGYLYGFEKDFLTAIGAPSYYLYIKLDLWIDNLNEEVKNPIYHCFTDL